MSTIELIKSDLWTGPKPSWFKGSRSTIRDPGDVTAWEVHQTAVAGGYGVSDRALERHGGDRWAALMERWEGSENYLDEDGRAGVPYHYLYRRQERRLVVLHHPDRYTWHGNGGNAYSLGFCIDGRWDKDHDDPTDGLAEAFELAILHASEVGYIPRSLEAHRQHASARGGDPGERLWPIFELTGAQWQIRPTLTHTTGSGNPIPDSWRPETPPTAETATVFLPVFLPVKGRKSTALALAQRELAARGYNAGTDDGLWGPKTEGALAGFKADRGMPPDNWLDGPTWTALIDVEE